MYKTARWQAIRTDQLREAPLCRMCQRERRTTAATICDHVEPHRGDEEKFFAGPFQSLCKPHHDSTKQAEEARGYVIGTDAKGRPLDPLHPWNRSAG